MRKAKSVLAILRESMRAKMSNSSALAEVTKAHPYSKISLSTVNYYRNQFRREGEKIPTERECRK